jgi:hypothetical protein
MQVGNLHLESADCVASDWKARSQGWNKTTYTYIGKPSMIDYLQILLELPYTRRIYMVLAYQPYTLFKKAREKVTGTCIQKHSYYSYKDCKA